MDRITYVDIHQGLDEVDTWLRSMGLDQNHRIRQNKRNLATMAEAATSGTLVDLIAKAALDGPVDLQAENLTSNRGRNTMFEIVLAGKLAAGGLKPILGGEPDVWVGLNDRNLLIQCKRVFSRNGILKCLKDASRQLKRDLLRSSDPRDCGLIAISLSRICNAGDKILVVPSEEALRDKLREEVDVVMAEVSHMYREVKDPKIAGVAFHLATPAFREDIKLYIASYSITVSHIAGKSDRALLSALSDYI